MPPVFSDTACGYTMVRTQTFSRLNLGALHSCRCRVLSPRVRRFRVLSPRVRIGVGGVGVSEPFSEDANRLADTIPHDTLCRRGVSCPCSPSQRNFALLCGTPAFPFFCILPRLAVLRTDINPTHTAAPTMRQTALNTGVSNLGSHHQPPAE